MSIDYEIRTGEDAKGHYIMVRSGNRAKHFAIHRNFTRRDKKGNSYTEKITKNIIPLIENSISKKGITEGFIIYDDDLNSDVALGDIKHKLQKKEINFTSTGEKLNFHWPIFWKLKETNYSSIIRATLTLHQVCSSRCPFCSTINIMRVKV